MMSPLHTLLCAIKAPLYIPHLLLYVFSRKTTKLLIKSDVREMNRRLHLNKSLLFYITTRKPYLNLFYYRLGKKSLPLQIYARPYPFFEIACESMGANAFVLNHPYCTIINAKSVGSNFTCCHLTTIGNAIHGRNDLIPTIGNNVNIGANVSILGDIKIGNNVIIGAGSVVVKDVPDNCVIAGCPAKVIKYIES